MPSNTETVTPTPTETETTMPTNTPVPSAITTATAPPGDTATPTATRTSAPTPTPANTPTAGVLIEVGSGLAAPGQQIRLGVTLHATQQQVGGTQNDILFDPHASVAAKADGTPDCAVNPGIGKEATSFTFQPPGCTPDATCERVRAFVLSFDNVDPIPDGSLLYTCIVSVAGDAAVGSDYPLVCSGVGASDPEGNAVAASCTDGRVSVAIACNGDCNGNDQVTVDELLKGVNIALGNLPVADCPAFDSDANGIVTVDELLKAVNTALNGCG